MHCFHGEYTKTMFVGWGRGYATRLGVCVETFVVTQLAKERLCDAELGQIYFK